MGQVGLGETRRGSDPSSGGMGLFHSCVWCGTVGFACGGGSEGLEGDMGAEEGSVL